MQYIPTTTIAYRTYDRVNHHQRVHNKTNRQKHWKQDNRISVKNLLEKKEETTINQLNTEWKFANWWDKRGITKLQVEMYQQPLSS
jgi:hypothetical protein